MAKKPRITPTVKAAVITVGFAVIATIIAFSYRVFTAVETPAIRSSLLDRWMTERKADTVENRYRIERLESLQMAPCKECIDGN